MSMYRLTCGLGCAIALAATSAMAQYSNIEDPGFSSPSSSARPGPQYFDIGGRAFRNGDIKYAIDMYQVSASWGYKPAEYNLAVMYAKGQGVPVDIPRAMAWMTLAAERGDTRRYTDARNAIGRGMSSAELDQADAILRELAPTYADKVALRRAKQRWKDERLSATGSKLGYVGNLTVGANAAEGTGQYIGSANGDAPPPSDGHGGGVPATTVITAGEITGGHQIDGSIAYRQLRETDNPYDPKFRNSTGTATVQPLIPVKDADAGKTPTSDQDADPGH